MTVITKFHYDRQLVLIGDVLLSGIESTNRSARVPSCGPVSNVFPSGSGYTITGLRQKLISIGDKLLIGWSGSLVAAQTVAKDFIAEYSKSGLTTEFLDNYLNNEIDAIVGQQSLSLIGYMHEPPHIYEIDYNVEITHETNRFGRITACGTGSNSIIRYFDQISSKQHKIVRGEPNLHEIAISTALGISGALLFDELIVPDSNFSHNLHQYFGGGYEVGILTQEGTVKVGDIMHIFCVAEPDENRGARISFVPKRLFKTTYVEDILAILSVEPIVKGVDGDSIDLDLKQDLYLIPPIWRDVENSEIENMPTPDLNAHWTCVHVLVTSPNALTTGHTKIVGSPNRNGPFNLNFNGDDVSIHWDKKFFDELIEDVSARYASQNKNGQT